MIANARKTLEQRHVSTEQFDFVQSQAENLGFLADESVDLVIAGMSTALHVFAQCTIASAFTLPLTLSYIDVPYLQRRQGIGSTGPRCGLRRPASSEREEVLLSGCGLHSQLQEI